MMLKEIGEEVKWITELAKIKSVQELVPVPLNNQTFKKDPTIGEDQYRVLEECLMMDYPITEAVMMAGISLASYYNHREKNPDFAIRMDRAREFPKMVARAAVQRRIRQWDAKVAMEYLKLRDKRYKTELVAEEWEVDNSPKVKVQFISVPSNAWADQTENDSQTPIKQSSPYDTSANSSENTTPWENEEVVLRNIDWLSSSSDYD